MKDKMFSISAIICFVTAQVIAIDEKPKESVNVILEPLPLQSEVVIAEPAKEASLASLSPGSIDAGAPREWIYADRRSANDIFYALAKKVGLQYYSNPSVDSVVVTGRIPSDDPRTAIQMVASSYGLISYIDKGTLFIRTVKEMKDLPTKMVAYHLRYLRQEKIEEMISPMLTPDLGKVKLEQKTNTVMIKDNEYVLNNVLDWLRTVDVPKRGVNLQVQIINLGDTDNVYKGVDWSSTLGSTGWTLSAGTGNSLNMLFNLNRTANPSSAGRQESLINSITPDTVANAAAQATGASFFTAPTAAILSPGQVSAVFRALRGMINTTTLASPNLMLEDNDSATIKAIDRFPIITYDINTSVSSSSSSPTISSKVRYKIDESDPTPSENNPGRELGVSLTVTPTILDDGTIRVMARPRTASITETREVVTGENTPSSEAPRVSESESHSTIRVPDGFTAILGGYYSLNKQKTTNKVPILGDMPLVGILFRSEQDMMNKTRLIFTITPTTFDPSNVEAFTLAQDNTMKQDHEAGIEKIVKAIPAKPASTKKEQR